MTVWKKNYEAEPIIKKMLKPFEDDNLYICGSNFSGRQAWTEGALETSEEVIKLIHGIKSQNHDISELKTKRDNSLIEILKIKKENKL